MCLNGTQVPCEVPSPPNHTTRKGWPHHRDLRPALFSKSDVGSFTPHKNKSVKVLWDGTYGFSSLSEKTRKSKHLQMSLQRQHFGLQFGRKLRRPPECWSGRGLNPRPPVRQTDALPTELTRPCLGFVHTIPDSFCFRIGLRFTQMTGDFSVLSVTERSYAVPISKVESRAIFVWPWRMVSVSVRHLFYQPMDEKIKTWTLRFPAKENPNMDKVLFDWPIVLQYDVKAKNRLISRKFSGIKFFHLIVRLTNEKPRAFVSVP